MIEISPKSFERRLTYGNAKLYVFSLGNGWRFPTFEELRRVHATDNDFENELHYTSDDTVLVSFSYVRFTWFYRKDAYDDSFVRPVRDIKEGRTWHSK